MRAPAVILAPPILDWYCPRCDLRERTQEPRPHTRFHICAGLGMLTAPMLVEGTKAKVEAHEREDVIGDELVRLDANGRPVMSIVTTRDEGQDVVVFAPTARGEGRAR